MMLRTTAILVTLLAQVIVSFAQGAFVLCVRHDGRKKLELAWVAGCHESDAGHCHCGLSLQGGKEPAPCDHACAGSSLPSRIDHEDCCCGDQSGLSTSHPETEAQGSSLSFKCDHCMDYPLIGSVLLDRPQGRQRQIGATDDLAIPAVFFIKAVSLPVVAIASDWLSVCGPPRGVLPIHIPTTVLRC